MYKLHVLSCVVLTLAFLTDGAPLSDSRKETQQQVEQLLLDLQLLLSRVRDRENPRLPILLKFNFYVPKKATELKHLQCLIEELKPLEAVLLLAESKNFPSEAIKELMTNINVTLVNLKGPETRFTCDYDDQTATIVEFLNKWITFCQSIFSTLT